MPWIIAVVAGLALGAMLVGSREARLALAGAAAVLVLLAAWFIISDQISEKRALTLIALDEVELRDTSIEKRRGLYYVLASIKNLSQAHQISTVTVQVSAQSCPDGTVNEACEIVGQASVSVNLKIPPDQVRSIEELINFAGLPDVETLHWTYTVLEVRADTD